MSQALENGYFCNIELNVLDLKVILDASLQKSNVTFTGIVLIR